MKTETTIKHGTTTYILEVEWSEYFHRWKINVRKREKGKKKWVYFFFRPNTYDYTRMDLDERSEVRMKMFMEEFTQEELQSAVDNAIAAMKACPVEIAG